MVAMRARLIAGGLLASMAVMTAPIAAVAWADDDPAPVADDPGAPAPVDPWADQQQWGRDVGANAAGNAAATGAGIVLQPFLGPFAGLASAPIGNAVDSAIRDGSVPDQVAGIAGIPSVPGQYPGQ